MSVPRFHEVAGIFPMMSPEEISRLAEDIKANGQKEPIYTHEGLIIDGRNRFMACRAAGIEPRMAPWDGRGSLVGFVVSLNLHRRHLDESQRAMVAAKIATLEDGQRQVGKFADVPTQADAADLLNVSERTVRNARAVVDSGAPELVAEVEAGRVAVSTAADVAALPQEQQREIVARGEKEILAAAKQIREQRKLHSLDVLGSSESNEWYTPSAYVEAARELMGGIDVDPASCAQANETVRASLFYSVEDDGLSQEWIGRVWLNPPYGRDEDHESNQGIWSRDLSKRFDTGEVRQAVLLVNAVTDRKWFAPLWDRCICFVSERIKFNAPGGQKAQPTHGNALVYFGKDAKRFVSIFSRFGRCVIPRDGFSVSSPGESK